MKTLKEVIVESKCRKGPSAGTTKRGAFWLFVEPTKIRRYGGDGIGQSGADCTNYLELRHYRDGTVAAVIHGHYWRQNGSAPDDWLRCDSLLECTSIEQLIVALKGLSFADGSHVFSDDFADKLGMLGLPEAEPAPDEA